MNKKILALLLAVLTLLSLTSAYALPAYGTRMQIIITPTCVDYNHVGDDWYQYFELNGYELRSGDTIDLYPGDSLTIFSQISEHDVLSDDYGTCMETYIVTSDLLYNGFTVQQYLTVMEDSGVYSGYWCEWYINFEFIPV